MPLQQGISVKILSLFLKITCLFLRNSVLHCKYLYVILYLYSLGNLYRGGGGEGREVKIKHRVPQRRSREKRTWHTAHNLSDLYKYVLRAERPERGGPCWLLKLRWIWDSRGCFVGLVVPAQETFILPWLLRSAQYKIFFSSLYTIWISTWSGSRAGPPVSECVSPDRTRNQHRNTQFFPQREEWRGEVRGGGVGAKESHAKKAKYKTKTTKTVNNILLVLCTFTNRDRKLGCMQLYTYFCRLSLMRGHIYFIQNMQESSKYKYNSTVLDLVCLPHTRMCLRAWRFVNAKRTVRLLWISHA